MEGLEGVKILNEYISWEINIVGLIFYFLCLIGGLIAIVTLFYLDIYKLIIPVIVGVFVSISITMINGSFIEYYKIIEVTPIEDKYNIDLDKYYINYTKGQIIELKSVEQVEKEQE